MPADDLVRGRVEGQAAKLAAVDRHDVDVGVAVDLAGEGDQRAVGGELGVALLALVVGEPAGEPTGGRRGPDVLGVGEDHGLAGDVGEAQQRPRGRNGGAEPEQHGDEDDRTRGSRQSGSHASPPGAGGVAPRDETV